MFAHLEKKAGTSNFLTPPGIARACYIINSCMYDAYALFDKKAVPSVLKKNKNFRLRKKIGEQYVIGSAFYCIRTTFKDFPQYVKACDKFFYKEFGLKGKNYKGYHIGKKVFHHFDNDGINALGNEPGTPKNALNNGHYTDYTNYHPVNPPQKSIAQTNCDEIVSLNHWQQILVPNKETGELIRPFYTPQAGLTKAFALKSPYQYIPPSPPQLNSNNEKEFLKEHLELIKINGKIGDLEKCIVSYWAGKKIFFFLNSFFSFETFF